MSKFRTPYNALMPVKKRTLRSVRARAMAQAARRSLRMAVRTPLRWGSTELKYLDCAFNAVTIPAGTSDASGLEMAPSSGCSGAISVPAQGDGESNRDGRKYTIKSVWASGVIDYVAMSDQADALDNTGTYLCLVLDTQCNGVTVISENVFTNPATAGRSLLPQPLRNLAYSKRYRILASTYVEPGGMYAMTDGTSTASLNGQQNPVVSLSWKGNIVCDSSGTTANVVSASDNAIHMLAFHGGGLSRTFNGKTRVRFIG